MYSGFRTLKLWFQSLELNRSTRNVAKNIPSMYNTTIAQKFYKYFGDKWLNQLPVNSRKL